MSGVQQHNHSGHSGNGGDGQSFGQMVGLEHQQHGHNFLSHLLGLDHQEHSGHGQHGGVGEGHEIHHVPSQSAGWNSALQAIKLSDALQGINVTPNFLFLILFFALIAWLYVIYWIRHHEPLANSVLGTHRGMAKNSTIDRRILQGTKNACGFRSSEHTGEVYVPGGAEASPTPVQPILPPVPAPPPQPLPLGSSYSAMPVQTSVYSNPMYGAPVQSNGVYPVEYASQENLSGNAYFQPVGSSSPSRVKMIVNR